MTDFQNQPNPQHSRAFWPIFIIIVVSLIAGGIIYFYANGNVQEDEVNSSTFWSHLNIAKPAAKSPTKPSTVPAK